MFILYDDHGLFMEKVKVLFMMLGIIYRQKALSVSLHLRKNLNKSFKTEVVKRFMF